MAKIINGMKFNDIIREIVINSHNENFKQYRYDCDNCTLSILTHEFSSRQNTVEVAIKTKDFSNFLDVNPYEDEYCGCNCAIIRAFPIVGLPLLLLQFTHCSEEYLDELWRGFYLIEGVY